MIIVTGGTGLVGSHLLYHLTLKNDKVVALFRTEESKDKTRDVFSRYTSDVELLFQKIIWQQADVTDVTSLEEVFNLFEINQVYHCAGMVSFNDDDCEQMRMVNIEGTANIVNFCIDYSVKRLLYVSSIATLGCSLTEQLIDETHQWNNDEDNSEYAISKNGGEMEVWRASQEGIDVVIVNPAVILGRGFRGGLSAVFMQVKKGLKFYTDGVTGFVGVDDLVRAMILLMTSEFVNERFVIVSENKSYKDVLFLIADTLNVKRPSIRLIKCMSFILWRMSWFFGRLIGKRPQITKGLVDVIHKKSYYTSDKFLSSFPDFQFEKIDNLIKSV